MSHTLSSSVEAFEEGKRLEKDINISQVQLSTGVLLSLIVLHGTLNECCCCKHKIWRNVHGLFLVYFL